ANNDRFGCIRGFWIECEEVGMHVKIIACSIELPRPHDQQRKAPALSREQRCEAPAFQGYSMRDAALDLHDEAREA
ncbi:hypothetical protein HAX54_007572, partial [Datura stramonium]|nr:hypothetical protein [Datura stramonium]